MQYIVAKIHNSSLGKVIGVSSLEEATENLIDWAEEQFQRKLTEEELEEIENCQELIDYSDADNHYSFSIGIVE